MKIHLKWIRGTAAAVIVAGIGVQPVAAQYAPYQPAGQQPASAQYSQPQAQAPAAQTPYAPYTAYRTPPATTTYPQTPAQGYQSPTGAQYSQPSAAYPQYPRYSQATSPYPASYGANPYVAQQPTATLPAPKNDSAAQMNGGTMNGAPASVNMSAAQGGAAGCNCNASYGAGDTYGAGSCGCNGSYPNYGISNYFDNDSCCQNQWFGGLYFLEMGRTNTAPVKLTIEIPAGAAYPYYPGPTANYLTSRDANFDFREGVEVRFGSTFTVGDACSTCQTGCNSCGPTNCGGCSTPTTYAWEFAWWGLDNNDSTTTLVYNANALHGMMNFTGLGYDRDGDTVVDGTVNSYYGYNPIPYPAPGAPAPGDVRVLAQRVRTDFTAQNVELNVIRFPVMACGPSCNTGCNAGCGGCDAGGCNGCNGGCDQGCGGGLGFSMYGSCGVRYFRLHDEFMYGNEFAVYSGGAFDQGGAYNGFTYDNSNELFYNVDVKNNFVGPQLGWTNDYCCGKWNLFLNSTFGIFDNHITSQQRMWSGGPGSVSFYNDGSNFNVNSHKDQVAFLGELRAGVAYDLTCHWRGTIAYRAVAMTGVATASGQIPSDFTNKEVVAIIDSDNSTIIHGAEIGAECRY